MKEFIMSHLENGGHLGDHQFGFRAKRSCLAQLLRYYEDILKNIEEGFNQDSIFLDFEKAFDKVDFGILCHRLMEKKIGGKVGIWLRYFLMGRTQRVIANGEASQISKMISGVPQGTVLGPVLFLLIIDSLGDLKLNATIMSFADDSKITMPIHNIEDALTLQECLEKLDKWQTYNIMCFNASKFNVLQMGKTHDLKEDYNYITPGNIDVN